MSKIKIGDATLYSVSNVIGKAHTEAPKNEVYDFIEFLIRKNIVEREAITYGKRTYYVYKPSAWFGVLMEGHIYAKEKKYKNEIKNGTLYFDIFCSKVLSRLHKKHLRKGLHKNIDIDLYDIMAHTAMEFIPKTNISSNVL